ncbi:ATP-dependent DNA helicase PIF1 [Trifolium medium]|uniref:ATP-dependent DNA helicase n=1 Tax=Trifolium medium TaxID=97028 RepID=A0A392M7E8_9FABA|nr:ATP-dependent DNA helicase PIF1 [Trifolium medium]
MSSEDLKESCLIEVDNFLRENEKSLEDYECMPKLKEPNSGIFNNILLENEFKYDYDEMKILQDEHVGNLNSEQLFAYEAIYKVVDNGLGSMFFVDGYGGTGKTFLWKTISYKLRSKGKIVVNVASSGIACILLPGGKTAHSQFGIPLVLTKESCCQIDKGSKKAQLLIMTNLIIWDEAPMINKWAFEAFERTLQDIMNGKIGIPEDGESIVEIPRDILIQSSRNLIGDIVEAIYPNLLENISVPDFFQDRAILAPTLDVVEEINDYVLALMPGDAKEYLSCDSISKGDDDVGVDLRWITTEFLNEIKCSGMPNHKLIIKVGVVIMLLRNIDVSSGLCNGTRLIVFHTGISVIGAKIVTGTNIGDIVYISRMSLVPSDANVSISFRRRQFPFCVCFAMTINKSQGQTLCHVGLYLPRPVFTHGQLYVAISRVKTRAGLKILIVDDDGLAKTSTVNVVYPEVFQRIYR